MTLASGAVADPTDITGISALDGPVTVSDTVTVTPTAGSASQAFAFNHSYGFYVDNAGAGSAGNRVWLDGPNGGEAVIGPRTGANLFGSIKLRTSQTTASAANCFIDSTTYQIKRSTSSRHYKQDIAAAPNFLPLLTRLQPVRFRDLAEVRERGDDAQWHVGLIAEDVHDIGLTEFVHYRDTPDGPVPDGVQYDRLAVALLGAVADLAQRVDALERGIRWDG